jgi:hypothetical protein
MNIHIDVHVHAVGDKQTPDSQQTADTKQILSAVKDILAQLGALTTQGATMAVSVQDLQDAITKLTADVAAETDVVTAVETTVTGLVDLSAAQKAQIADLLAQLGAGGTVTAEQLQGLLDSANATDAAVLAAKDRLSAAVVKGTPSA